MTHNVWFLNIMTHNVLLLKIMTHNVRFAGGCVDTVFSNTPSPPSRNDTYEFILHNIQLRPYRPQHPAPTMQAPHCEDPHCQPLPTAPRDTVALHRPRPCPRQHPPQRRQPHCRPLPTAPRDTVAPHRRFQQGLATAPHAVADLRHRSPETPA